MKELTWYDYMLGFIQAVAKGEAGQAGKVGEIGPPDERVKVTLSVQRGLIRVSVNGHVTDYPAKQASQAVSVYAAAVEGAA